MTLAEIVATVRTKSERQTYYTLYCNKYDIYRQIISTFQFNKLGNLKLKNNRISSMRLALFVLNSFNKKRMTTKSRERISLLFRPQLLCRTTRLANICSIPAMRFLPKRTFPPFQKLHSGNENMHAWLNNNIIRLNFDFCLFTWKLLHIFYARFALVIFIVYCLWSLYLEYE
jgi:hypothetical protein